MAKEIKKKCPLVGEECWGHECEWFIKVQGTHPQTGESVDQYDCTYRWLPMLLIENSQQQKQTGAAVESFRNEMVEANNKMIKLAAQEQIKLLDK